MNQQNRENLSLNNDKQFKDKINRRFRGESWFRLINRNKFGYFTATVMFLTLFINIISPAKSVFSQSVVYDSDEAIILAQEETEEEAEEKPSETEREAKEKPSETEREAEEKPSEEEEEPEEELSFKEEKEALEEEIDEHYEEWKSRKTSIQISHSFSAITTIVLTIVITLVGTGLFVIPSGRIVILILGLITVLIQLNSNIFLLEKNLAGYRLAEEQALMVKEKLESVETKKELIELKETFKELVLEALILE